MIFDNPPKVMSISFLQQNYPGLYEFAFCKGMQFEREKWIEKQKTRKRSSRGQPKE